MYLVQVYLKLEADVAERATYFQSSSPSGKGEVRAAAGSTSCSRIEIDLNLKGTKITAITYGGNEKMARYTISGDNAATEEEALVLVKEIIRDFSKRSL